MTAKTAEQSWISTSRETGKDEVVLMHIAGLVNRIRLYAAARRQLRNLSPAHLQDIGLDPFEVRPATGRTVDPATLANLMALR